MKQDKVVGNCLLHYRKRESGSYHCFYGTETFDNNPNRTTMTANIFSNTRPFHSLRSRLVLTISSEVVKLKVCKRADLCAKFAVQSLYVRNQISISAAEAGE